MYYILQFKGLNYSFLFIGLGTTTCDYQLLQQLCLDLVPIVIVNNVILEIEPRPPSSTKNLQLSSNFSPVFSVLCVYNLFFRDET